MREKKVELLDFLETLNRQEVPMNLLLVSVENYVCGCLHTSVTSSGETISQTLSPCPYHKKVGTDKPGWEEKWKEITKRMKLVNQMPEYEHIMKEFK
jgi:hypothetical protein